MDQSKIEVTGFYESPYIPNRPLSQPGHRRVCFLGQPWYKYSEDIGKKYLKITCNIFEIVRKQGVKIFYKPHPWEDMSVYSPIFEEYLSISLHECFEQCDVFVSFTSTALLQAEYAGRISVQIKDSIFNCDDFSIYNGVYSIEYEDAFFSKKFFDIINIDKCIVNYSNCSVSNIIKVISD